MTGGTVNLSRGIWDDPAFKDEPFTEREAFMWLFSEASYKDREKRIGSVVVKLKRCQLAVSTRFMARAWQWSEPRVRRYLKRLKNRRMIDAATDAGITIITVCNYEKYQTYHGKSDAPPEPKSTQQRRTTDANEKKGVIKKIEDTNVSSAFKAFKTCAKKAGWPVPRTLTAARKRTLVTRLRDVGGLAEWQSLLMKAASSDLISRGSWFSFDWILKPQNLQKLMEGNYDNRNGGSNDRNHTPYRDPRSAADAQRTDVWLEVARQEDRRAGEAGPENPGEPRMAGGESADAVVPLFPAGDGRARHG